MKIKKGSYCDKKLREFVASGDAFKVSIEKGFRTVELCRLVLDYNGQIGGDDFLVEVKCGVKFTKYRGSGAAKKLIEFYEEHLGEKVEASEKDYSDECKKRSDKYDEVRQLNREIRELERKRSAAQSAIEELQSSCRATYKKKNVCLGDRNEFKASLPKDTIPDEPKLVERIVSTHTQPRDKWDFDRDFIVDQMSDGSIICKIEPRDCPYPNCRDAREVLTGSKANVDYAKEYVKVMAREKGFSVTPDPDKSCGMKFKPSSNYYPGTAFIWSASAV